MWAAASPSTRRRDAAAISRLCSAIRSFFGRWLQVVAIGVVIALVRDVSNWNWQGYPMDWTRGYVMDHVGGMVLLGFLMALIVTPSERPGARGS